MPAKAMPSKIKPAGAFTELLAHCDRLKFEPHNIARQLDARYVSASSAAPGPWSTTDGGTKADACMPGSTVDFAGAVATGQDYASGSVSRAGNNGSGGGGGGGGMVLVGGMVDASGRVLQGLGVAVGQRT